MAGYSKNPLWKKLGIKVGHHCFVYQLPKDYFDLLEETPKETEWDETLKKSSYNFMHIFLTEKKELETGWSNWKNHLKKDGSLWISWPKGTSKVKSDLSGNIIREFGLEGGLVDVKVCAVNDDWSGLKFMYRKEDR